MKNATKTIMVGQNKVIVEIKETSGGWQCSYDMTCIGNVAPVAYLTDTLGFGETPEEAIADYRRSCVAAAHA